MAGTESLFRLGAGGEGQDSHTHGGAGLGVAGGVRESPVLSSVCVCVCVAPETGQCVTTHWKGKKTKVDGGMRCRDICLWGNCSPALAQRKDFSPVERNTLMSTDLWSVGPRSPVP